jgi:hypothetical protein
MQIDLIYNKIIELKGLQRTDFWTSGTDSACKGVNFWASTNKKLINKKMSWTDVSSGDCVTVQYFNGSSQFSKFQCDKEMNFICEVSIFSALKRFTVKIKYSGSKYWHVCPRPSKRVHASMEHNLWYAWEVVAICEPLI